MPSTPPQGEPAPPDGALPATAPAELGDRPFRVYVHVPFCASRCGYCDFNTYTATELGGQDLAASYADRAVAEVRFARRVLGAADLPVTSVFFGGGTPTLLPADDLGRILAAVRAEFGLARGAEVTVEANPESVDPAALAGLADAGVTRLSLGMQSAVPRVLAVLDRRHTAGRPAQVVGWAREAGIGQVSLDLIYGTPGETEGDWRTSLDAALAAAPHHVSAYALTVEPGTRLARRVARGEIPAPDDDDLADRYLQADASLEAAGLSWYEVSNWARPGAACRHNLGYWRGDDWWGVGPGAHSHVGGVRWWNVRHPARYADLVASGRSPAQGREVLTAADRYLEQVMLGVRLAGGIALDVLDAPGRAAATAAAADGLLDGAALAAGRVALTLRGRLVADAVVRNL